MPNANATTPVASLFVLAHLRDGTQVVSQFSKLEGLETYSRQVFSGAKPFNAWTVASTVHPASGEPCLVRRRRLIPGDQIAEMEAVELRPGVELASGIEYLDPTWFQPKLVIQRGEAGLHTFEPTEANPLPEGAVAGVEYPIHRQAVGYYFHKYVILRAANGDVEELRFWIDPLPAEGAAPGLVSNHDVNEAVPADGDDDWGDDED